MIGFFTPDFVTMSFLPVFVLRKKDHGLIHWSLTLILWPIIFFANERKIAETGIAFLM